MTEPTAGSDAGGTKTTAKRNGDQWVLNGSKTFTTHASVGDVAVLMASTDPSKKHHGIFGFRGREDQPGLPSANTRTSWGCVRPTPPRWC
ncbi:MAG: acyl-CoA dehydrogenase family protein [Acidobacteriota bacterium]